MIISYDNRGIVSVATNGLRYSRNENGDVTAEVTRKAAQNKDLQPSTCLKKNPDPTTTENTTAELRNPSSIER